MKGLVFELSVPKYVLAKGIGGMYPKVHYGRTLLGSYFHGPENFRGERQHTFDLVLGLLARRDGPDPSMLMTHTFPLARYQLTENP